MSAHNEMETTMKLASTSRYPVGMSAALTLARCTLDAMGMPYHSDLVQYHPTTIAQYALAYWNLYLASLDENDRNTFLAQAYWFVEHEVRISDDAGGWPITLPLCGSTTRGL